MESIILEGMIINQAKYAKKSLQERKNQLQKLSFGQAAKRLAALLQAGSSFARKIERPLPVSLAYLLKKG